MLCVECHVIVHSLANSVTCNIVSGQTGNCAVFKGIVTTVLCRAVIYVRCIDVQVTCLTASGITNCQLTASTAGSFTAVMQMIHQCCCLLFQTFMSLTDLNPSYTYVLRYCCISKKKETR